MAKGSKYLEAKATLKPLNRKRSTALAGVFFIFALFLGLFASIPAIFDSPQQSDSTTSLNGVVNNGYAFICGDPKSGSIGTGMSTQKDWRTSSASYPRSDATGRILTAQEAFGNGITYTNFYGTGEGTGFWPLEPTMGLQESEEKDGVPSVLGLLEGERTSGAPAHANWFKNMSDSRDTWKCGLGAIGTALPNLVLGVSTMLTSLMTGIASFAFDPGFICDPDNPGTMCIDLVGIIGGSGSGSGVIGKLTTSIYFPLLTLAGLLVGVWVVWNGLAKRQFRETFLGLIWTVVVTVLGIVFLLNPQMLARAPMVVGNTLTTCVIGAFTGTGGCTNNTSTTAPTNQPAGANYCMAHANGGPVDSASLTIASMGCELWKAFVLQPYAQSSFGAPLDSLNTAPGQMTPELTAILQSAGYDGKDFCLSTKLNSGKLDDYEGKRLDLKANSSGVGMGEICNLAVYQAYAGLNIKSGSDSPPANGAVNTRYLNVAMIAANDDGMYRAWAPADMHFGQFGYALLGAFSALLASVVIFVVSAFALAFYITSILMIAFAPFFLLAGIHPGKGKQMMVGWLGQVLSNIMKYVASALFLVITIALYSAVLSNVSNMGAILIFMIILTVALLMYRRELVDMIGVIDLGGEKLSNKFAEKTMDRVKNTGKTGMAVAGGVTAGVLSNGVKNPFSVDTWKPSNIARDIGNIAHSGIDAGGRSIKGRSGFLGETLKASDRISANNKQKIANEARNAKSFADSAHRELEDSQSAMNAIADRDTEIRVAGDAKIQALQERADEANENRPAIAKAIDVANEANRAGISAIDDPNLRQYQEMLHQLQNLKIKADVALETGDTAAYDKLQPGIENLQNRINQVAPTFSDGELGKAKQQYEDAYANKFNELNGGENPISSDQVAATHDGIRQNYKDAIVAVSGLDHKKGQIQEETENALRDLDADKAAAALRVEQARNKADNADRAYELAAESARDVEPGRVITSRRAQNVADSVRATQDDRSAEAASAAAGVRGGDVYMDASNQVADAGRRVEDSAATLAAASERAREARSEATVAQKMSNVVSNATDQTAKKWMSDGDSSVDQAKRATMRFLENDEKEGVLTTEIHTIMKDQELTEDVKRNLIAKREEEIAKARNLKAQAELALKNSGSNIQEMQDKFLAETESLVAGVLQIDRQTIEQSGGLSGIENNLKSAAAEAVAEARRAVEAESAAKSSARQALKDQKESQSIVDDLESASGKVEDRAGNGKPMSEKELKSAKRKIDRAANKAGSQMRDPLASGGNPFASGNSLDEDQDFR